MTNNIVVVRLMDDTLSITHCMLRKRCWHVATANIYCPQADPLGASSICKLELCAYLPLTLKVFHESRFDQGKHNFASLRLLMHIQQGFECA